MTDNQSKHNILMTGPTGYIGGLLLRRLMELGHRVRCLSRRPEEAAGRLPEGAEAVGGDVLEADGLLAALEGMDTAYYLVHSMASGASYAENDRKGAENFAAACRRAGVKRIIYLGGLGQGAGLSEHLRSRQEVGEILRASGVSTIEFRAAVVIGAGSLSFEMVRTLVERLPVMVTPRWVRTPTQPIAADDVIAYLVAGLALPGQESRVVEIGGSEVTSYKGLMREYARQRRLRRLFIPVPVLTPYLSSLWLKLVTPLFARVGRALIEGVRNPTVVSRDDALRLFPVEPLSVSQAVARAMQPSSLLKVEVRTRQVPCAPEDSFQPIQRIGGRQGWYFATWLWKLRAWIDRLLGGVGMRRGRRHPVELNTGEPLDFWTVEKIEKNRVLKLRADMKLPGTAWLEFWVTPQDGGSRIRQIATFDPRAIGGRIYWYLLLPFHKLIFSGLLRRIAARALRKRRGTDGQRVKP